MFVDMITNLDAGCGGAGGAVGGRQHVLRGDQGAAAPGHTFKIFYAVIKYFSVENIFSFKYLPRSDAASRDDPHLPGVLVNLGLLAADNSINSVRADIIDVLDIITWHLLTLLGTPHTQLELPGSGGEGVVVKLEAV